MFCIKSFCFEAVRHFSPDSRREQNKDYRTISSHFHRIPRTRNVLYIFWCRCAKSTYSENNRCSLEAQSPESHATRCRAPCPHVHRDLRGHLPPCRVWSLAHLPGKKTRVVLYLASRCSSWTLIPSEVWEFSCHQTPLVMCLSSSSTESSRRCCPGLWPWLMLRCRMGGCGGMVFPGADTWSFARGPDHHRLVEVVRR